MEALLANKQLVAAFIAVIIAQLLKILFNLLLEGRFAIEQALSTGGMPSSHSATVTALTTSIGLDYGVSHTYFALSLVFAIVVIHDAVGIRRAAGRHAELLNEWSQLLSEIYEKGFQVENLKTLLGHTYPQVMAGIGLGMIVGYVVTVVI
ncbi:MAG: divergent PAP2 family protein [Spirochaetota bacterium]